MTTKLLSVGVDAKTSKGEKKGYLTGILYLAPHIIGGGRSLCPFSTAGCRAVCLYTAGRGGFNNVQTARIRKTQWWLNDPKGFLNQLSQDITTLVQIAAARGLVPAVRLNGTTDIPWENHGIIEQHPDVQHYDYTKWPALRRGALPSNYHLTYSFSEKPNAAEQALAWKVRGVNTAVVFRGSLPKAFKFTKEMGYSLPVINGDESDLRFTDPKGVVVGLVAKGKARQDEEVGAGYFVQKGGA